MNDRRAGFEALFREVYEPLQRYARRRTDLSTADDVVAETLLVLWRRLDDVPSGSALPWSYGVARRCLANQRRGDQRRAQLVERLTGQGLDAAPPVDAVLEAALEDLSSDDREIVRLWAWEQLPARELGVALGISANAASIRLHRAKGRLSEAVARKSRHGAGQEVVEGQITSHAIANREEAT